MPAVYQSLQGRWKVKGSRKPCGESHMACDSNGSCKQGHLSLCGHTNWSTATERLHQQSSWKTACPFLGIFHLDSRHLLLISLSQDRTYVNHPLHYLICSSSLLFINRVFRVYECPSRACVHMWLSIAKNKFSKVAVWKTTSCSINTHVLQYYVTIFSILLC